MLLSKTYSYNGTLLFEQMKVKGFDQGPKSGNLLAVGVVENILISCPLS